MPDTSNSHKAICWSVRWKFPKFWCYFCFEQEVLKYNFLYTDLHSCFSNIDPSTQTSHTKTSQSHLCNYQKPLIQTRLLVWVFEATTMLDRPSLILRRWSCARGSASSGWRGCSWLAGLIGSRFLPRKFPYSADLYCSLWSLYLSAVFHNKSTMKIWKKYSRAISQFVPKLCLPTTNPQDQHVLISDQ